MREMKGQKKLTNGKGVCQLSTINCQLSTVNYHLFYHLPTIIYHPFGRNPLNEKMSITILGGFPALLERVYLRPGRSRVID
jgi:hypothetical protein